MNTKKLILASIFAGLAVSSALAKDSDPVLMTVNGHNVYLSEFEYLYNKNNTQQAEPVTFDEYVRMFTDYKLKVADAQANGVDTTANFVEEFKKFRNELSAPYFVDKPTQERLQREAYDRMAEEVFVSHIMFPFSAADGTDNKAVADSVRTAIIDGKITFEDVARKFSVDQRSAVNGGKMAWVVAGSYPWQFEEMAFNTPVNGISPVVNSGFGYHIIRVDERRPAQGEVKAQHILILTRDKSADEAANAKVRIDSIYQVAIQPGTDFSDLARRFSEDPGSARNGGDLGWFGHGRMVAEFDSAAYATATGEISKPFATAYGYHIVKTTDRRGGIPLPPFEEVQENIAMAIARDTRAHLPAEAFIESLGASTKSSINPDIAQTVRDILKSNNFEVCDSAAIELLKASTVTAYTIKNKPVTIGQVLVAAPIQAGSPAAAAASAVADKAQKAYKDALYDIARVQLYDTNPEYRNLVNEYRDGIMLFEVSNANVWDRATKDKEGLEAYFTAHRDEYKWDAPRLKSYIIFAENDSVLTLAKEYAAQFNPATTDQETFTSEMKKRFGKDVKIERVIAAKGDNAITDYLAFGAAKPATNPGQRWACYATYGAQIIDAPQEAADVRAKVVSDYQAYLEKQWIDHLRATYPVKINDKVLKKARENAQKSQPK